MKSVGNGLNKIDAKPPSPLSSAPAKKWHPLTRLNFLIALVFIAYEIMTALVVSFWPGTIDGSMIDLLLIMGTIWWFGVVFCVFWVMSNAIWLSWHQIRERGENKPQLHNLLFGWGVPVIFVVLILSWFPIIEGLTDHRLKQEFETARPEMLQICNQILAEGSESTAIQVYRNIGDYTDLNVIYSDTIIYFERADIVRTFGYACVAEGTEVPQQDIFFEYEKIDERFYYFSEIEQS